jgi:hypothetical protein
LNDTLASIAATQKIVIVLKDSSVDLKSVSLGEKNLEVAVALEGTADLTVNAIPIPVK